MKQDRQRRPGLSLYRDQWTSGQRHGAMALICVVAFFNLIDRQILSILMEPIKKEFGASDTMMGLLAGSTFAIFYSLASLPLARASDRYPRGVVLAISLGAWSVMTSLGGFAQSFVQLAVTRIGVAVGEAGSGPTSYSLAADLYPLRHRGKAIAAYACATSVGIGGAVMLGGWLVEHVGWRGTLLAMGVPGVLLSGVVLLGLKEPPRGMADGLADEKADESYGFLEVLRYLWTLRSYRCIILIASAGGGAGYASLLWGPTFMMRIHDMSSTEVGLLFGGGTIAALLIGQAVASVVADWAGQRDIRAYMWVTAVSCAIAAPFGLVFAFAGNSLVAMAGFMLFYIFQSPFNLCCITMSQTLVPPRMRGMASTVSSLATNLFGFGVVPLVMGATNDLLAPQLGGQAIRYSMILAGLMVSIAVVGALLATIWLKADYARLHGEKTP